MLLSYTGKNAHTRETMSNKADLAETKEPFHSLTAAEVFREFASLS